MSLKKALTDKNSDIVDVLRSILSAAHNEAIAKKKTDKKLSESELTAVVRSQAKRRKESIEAFQKGNRPELAKKEAAELAMIEAYLPKQLSEEGIKKIVQEVVGKIEGEKSFGLVMKQVMAKCQGRGDGQVVSRLVKEALTE